MAFQPGQKLFINLNSIYGFITSLGRIEQQYTNFYLLSQRSFLLSLGQNLLGASPVKNFNISAFYSNQFFNRYSGVSNGASPGRIVLGYSMPAGIVWVLSGNLLFLMSYYHRYLSSLVRFFGAGVKQDNLTLTIQKNSLPFFTPRANNTAESMLAALILQVWEFESNSLISTVYVEKQPSSYSRQNLLVYLIHTFSIKLYLKVTFLPDDYAGITNYDTPIDPDNY